MSKDTLLSIIVPVYNVAPYLDDCVDSLLVQAGVNHEIILVDDGSTDGSSARCDYYAQKFSDRVTVVHKQNEGLNFARKDGFLASKGNLVTFVDSDDLISLDYVKNLYGALVKHKADVAICGFQSFTKKIEFQPNLNEEPETAYEKNKDTILDWLIIGGAPWHENMHVMTAWGKLYRRSVIEKVDWDFSNYRANEDDFWTTQTFNNIGRGAVVVNAKMYGYRQNPNSITRKKYTNTYHGQKLTKFELIEELYRKSAGYLDASFNNKLLYRFLVQLITFLDMYSRDKTLTINDIQTASAAFKKRYREAPAAFDMLPGEFRRNALFMRRWGVWTYVLLKKLPVLRRVA